MATLQATLACAGNSTGVCAGVDGSTMYDFLINSYMEDPSTIRDVWSPFGNPLYLFAFTIVSTIGYGSFAPKTPGGQIFTVFYALVRVE